MKIKRSRMTAVGIVHDNEVKRYDSVRFLAAKELTLPYRVVSSSNAIEDFFQRDKLQFI